MADVAYRTLGPADEDLLALIAEGVLDGPVDAAEAHALLADPAHVLTVALAEGRVVGAVLSVVSRFVDKPPELWINEVGVADACQGQGIGRALMQAAFDEARARGCTAAWVAADRTEQAMGFYRALGGAEEGGLSHFTWYL